MAMKKSVFWNVTPCSQLKVNSRFRGMYRLRIQGGRISQTKNQHEKVSMQSQAGFLLGLKFDPEDGGDIFI
jgi:hypothetical protein